MKRRPLMTAVAVAMLSLVPLQQAARAQSGGILPAVVAFGLIGYGETFISSFISGERCRTTFEAAREGGRDVLLTARTTIGGAVIGAGVGTAIGSIGGDTGMGLGLGIGAAAGAIMGIAAQGRERATAEGDILEGEASLQEEFNTRACGMIVASQDLVLPLTQRYNQIMREFCGIDVPDDQPIPDAGLREGITCANNQHEVARSIVLQKIRINQGTCFAIEQMGEALVRGLEERGFIGGGTLDMADTAECDMRPPEQVWSQFVSERLN